MAISDFLNHEWTVNQVPTENNAAGYRYPLVGARFRFEDLGTSRVTLTVVSGDLPGVSGSAEFSYFSMPNMLVGKLDVRDDGTDTLVTFTYYETPLSEGSVKANLHADLMDIFSPANRGTYSAGGD